MNLQYILYEDGLSARFLPLTYTQPFFNLRLGIDTLHQKWERLLGAKVLRLGSGNHLALGDGFEPKEDAVFLNARFIPDAYLVERLVQSLQMDQGYYHAPSELIAFRTSGHLLRDLGESYIDLSSLPMNLSLYEVPDYQRLRKLERVTDLFRMNGEQIRMDFAALTRNRTSASIDDPHTIVYAPENVFLEEGVKIRAAVLNAEDGPIYIGKDAQIMEGALIHGAHAICEGAVVQMGARLRGDSTLGPFCKVGGEVSNTVFMGYSNKGHDGFLGNSIIGNWCNLGAGCTSSNLKNNYSNVRIFNFQQDNFEDTGLQFCGLILGDYSRIGIQTALNTGTIVGTCCNLFGSEMPPKHVPSFSWGHGEMLETYDMMAAFKTIEMMMKRRNQSFLPQDRTQLLHAFETTERYRIWEY